MFALAEETTEENEPLSVFFSQGRHLVAEIEY